MSDQAPDYIGIKEGQAGLNFKDDAAGYSAIHRWVRDHNPKTGRCEWCGAEQVTEYATKTQGTYTRDRADYFELCRPCHAKHDGVGERQSKALKGRKLTPSHRERATVNARLASAVASANRRARTHCKNGHEFTDENTYVVPKTGHRVCRVCSRKNALRAYYNRKAKS